MLGTNQHVTTADRIKALREKLGLVQEDLVERTGGDLDRTEVSKIEKGKNKLTTYRMRDLLARGLGLSMEDLIAYISGTLSIEEAALRSRPAPPAPPVRGYPVDEEIRRKAIVLLKQPPQRFSKEAIDIAFETLVMLDPDDARNPGAVADVARIQILGSLAATPPSNPENQAPARARRSQRRSLVRRK